MSSLGVLLKSMSYENSSRLWDRGELLGKLYTDHGLPIDMSLGRVKADPKVKLLLLGGALNWLVEHKRQSGATDKAIDRQRDANRAALQRFISKGEVDV